jgi:hypothetical protein
MAYSRSALWRQPSPFGAYGYSGSIPRLTNCHGFVASAFDISAFAIFPASPQQLHTLEGGVNDNGR